MRISQVLIAILSVSLTALFTGCSMDSAGASEAATIRLLTLGRDASIGPAPIDAFGFQAFGTLMLFRASTDVYGREPWISDGTPDGTMMLRNIAPGSMNSIPAIRNDVGFMVLGDRAYFAADDFVHGLELWTTDGTPEGTRLYAEFIPGSDGIWFVGDAAVVGNKLFFTIHETVDDVDPVLTWVIEDHDLEL